MLESNEPETPDDRIIALASSSFSPTDDGNVMVYLVAEEEGWTAGSALRLTEFDALELRDMLGQAAELVSGSVPQAFISLVIHD